MSNVENKEYCVFQVNGILPEFIIHHDTTVFQMEQGIATLYLGINAPTHEMVNTIGVNYHSISFALYCKKDIMNLCVQVGNSCWMDTPIIPHPSQEQMSAYEDGMGMPMLCVLVDTSNGRILQLRMFALPNKFSNQLVRSFNTLVKTRCSVTDFLMKAKRLQCRYTPEQLAQLTPKEATCTIQAPEKTTR